MAEPAGLRELPLLIRRLLPLDLVSLDPGWRRPLLGFQRGNALLQHHHPLPLCRILSLRVRVLGLQGHVLGLQLCDQG
jgi:hypothetical protein